MKLLQATAETPAPGTTGPFLLFEGIIALIILALITYFALNAIRKLKDTYDELIDRIQLYNLEEMIKILPRNKTSYEKIEIAFADITTDEQHQPKVRQLWEAFITRFKEVSTQIGVTSQSPSDKYFAARAQNKLKALNTQLAQVHKELDAAKGPATDIQIISLTHRESLIQIQRDLLTDILGLQNKSNHQLPPKPQNQEKESRTPTQPTNKTQEAAKKTGKAITEAGKPLIEIVQKA